MCNYLSALVMPDGEIVTHPATDSHEDLMASAGIRDARSEADRIPCARVEFAPPRGGRLADIEAYRLALDEERAPDWWDEPMIERVTARLRAIAEARIVRDEREILLGGVWVLADGARVEKAVGARILAMYGSSSVGDMYGSSSVRAMYGTSSVGSMYDSSSVRIMYGTSSVGSMYDSSSVRAMYGTSSVGIMCNTSSVGFMYDTSSVGAMHDTPSVGAMHDTPSAPRKPRYDRRTKPAATHEEG